MSQMLGKVVGGRTAFNLLGPLTNPAMSKKSANWCFFRRLPRKNCKNFDKEKMRKQLCQLDQMMEWMSYPPLPKIKFAILKNNTITKMTLDPQEVGLQKGNISDIQISSKEDAINHL